MYTTLLFDNDNTLLDFEKAEDCSFEKAYRKMGLNYSEEIKHRYKEINDSLWKKLESGEITSPSLIKTLRFKILFKELEIDADSELIASYYKDFLSKSGFLMDGAQMVLKTLYGRYKMYIITNGIAEIQKSRISISGLDKYVDGIFISEEIGYSKPDKRYFDYVLSHIPEKDKSKVLVIGDRVSSDIMGAVNAGLDSVLIDKSADNSGVATYTVNSIGDIINGLSL